MFSEYSKILGIIAVGLSIVGYIPYFINIFKNKTKPHAFTWFVWGLITGLGFVIQFLKGGGYGSYVTGVSALLCFAISVLALKKGEIIYDKNDWASFICALFAILLWYLTDNSTLAVFLIIAGDALGFIPTFRKGWKKPFEETAISFVFNSLKYTVALLAMASYSIDTALYPLYLVFANGIFAIMLIWKRTIIKK